MKFYVQYILLLLTCEYIYRTTPYYFYTVLYNILFFIFLYGVWLSVWVISAFWHGFREKYIKNYFEFIYFFLFYFYKAGLHSLIFLELLTQRLERCNRYEISRYFIHEYFNFFSLDCISVECWYIFEKTFFFLFFIFQWYSW